VKLVMTLLVRDEEDILEAHLDYHFRQGVDFVIATDNNSKDATPEILEAYGRTGRLHLIREPGEDYLQSKWVTRMARMAATEFGADWVINADADTFHWPERSSLKEVFAAIPPEYGALDMPVVHFLPRPDESAPFFERMLVREVRSFKPNKRRDPLLKRAHRARPDVVVGTGSHAVTLDGLDPEDSDPPPGLRTVPAWQPIVVLHFPLRSYAQYERKIAGAGLAFTSRTIYGLQGGEGLAETARRPEGRRKSAYELLQDGRLREFYAAKVVDDEAVVAGMRQGRLVVDDRLKSFFAAGRDERRPVEGAARAEDDAARPATAGGTLAWNEEGPEVAELRADMMRMIWERRHDPRSRELDEMRAELTEIKGSLWWRLGERLYGVRRLLSRRRGSFGS
jgi:hypothetical protein